MADDPPTGTAGSVPSMRVTVTPDRGRGRVEVGWELAEGACPPGAVVAGHRVWLCVEGHGIAWNRPGELWRTDHITLRWSMFAQSVPVPLELRVVVVLADGSEVGPVTAGFVIPAAHDLARSPEWAVGTPEVLVDDATRRDAGLGWWPDGSIGFASVEGEVHAFAANGPRCSHWVLGDDAFLGRVVATSTAVEGLPAGLDYAAGGPVHHDAASGALVLFVHEEVHPGGEPMQFWSAIGLAVSTDGGSTFRYLGRVVAPEIPAEAPQRFVLTEVGGAPFVLHDGWFHLYFRETTGDGETTNLGVARAPADEVVAAALAGTVTPWAKHRDGRWDEAGLGGVASDLLADGPAPRWFDVVHLVDHDRYVLVHSDGMVDRWAYVVRTSTDGIAWSPPEHLGAPETGAELLYLTLAGPDLGDPRRVAGDVVHLYRTRTAHTGSRRWDDARLERRVLTYRPRGGA